MKIFISYRRDDSAGYAGRIFDHLSARFGADNVFMDIDTIQPGEDFRKVISTAVGTCDVVLVLMGKQWLSMTDAQGRSRLEDPRDWVRMEVAAALANRRIRVIPVLVRGASVPSENDLPAGLKELVWRNAIELSDSRFQYDVQKLINVIERLEVKPPASALPPKVTAKKNSTRSVLLLGGSSLLLVLLLFGWIFGRSYFGAPATDTPEVIPTQPPAVEFTLTTAAPVPAAATMTSVPLTDTSTPEPSPTATQQEVTGYLVSLVDSYHKCINNARHDQREDYKLCWDMLSDRPGEFQDYLNQNSGGLPAFTDSWNKYKVSYALYYCYSEGQHLVYAEYYYHPWDNLPQITGGQNILEYRFALDSDGWRITGAFVRSRISTSCEIQPRVDQLSLYQ